MQDTPPKTDQSIIPHLTVEGAGEAMTFYERAFGAEPLYRQEMPDGSGRLIHASMRIGNSLLMLVDHFPEMGTCSPRSVDGAPLSIHLNVADCDALVARAKDAGCEVVMEPQDMFWGDRFAQLKCPYGHVWSIGSHVRDVTPEEMEAAMKEMFACG